MIGNTQKIYRLESLAWGSHGVGKRAVRTEGNESKMVGKGCSRVGVVIVLVLAEKIESINYFMYRHPYYLFIKPRRGDYQ